jgi:cytochrome o ubiquinol oxidase operon protein cyoD
MSNKEITKSYINGFVLSTLMTLLSYFVVVDKVFSGWTLLVAIMALALVQLSIQLIFFLHILQGSKPHWNLGIVVSTLSIILVIIIGSIWIMTNLNYNHMTPAADIEKYIIHEEGIHN